MSRPSLTTPHAKAAVLAALLLLALFVIANTAVTPHAHKLCRRRRKGVCRLP
jgi:hypothetical protein